MPTQEGDLVYGCLTHVPLWIDFPSFVTPIYLGESQGGGRQNLRDLAPEWEAYHPILGGLAGTFALKAYVQKFCPDAKKVGICQYRKFISRQKIGTPSANYKTMNVLPKSELDRLSLDDLMAPGGTDFLIGQPAGFKIIDGVRRDYLGQYGDAHVVEDFLRFTAEAAELGVLERAEVHSFLHETIFFPGGVEIGVFPADFWLKTVAAIEFVVCSCVLRHPATRDGYQARVWAFCAERLGSYLLLKHLKTNYTTVNWPDQFCGHINLINQDESLNYVPGT